MSTRDEPSPERVTNANTHEDYEGNWHIEYKDDVDSWYYVTGLGWVHEYTGANGKIIHDNDGKFYEVPSIRQTSTFYPSQEAVSCTDARIKRLRGIKPQLFCKQYIRGVKLR